MLCRPQLCFYLIAHDGCFSGLIAISQHTGKPFATQRYITALNKYVIDTPLPENIHFDHISHKFPINFT